MKLRNRRVKIDWQLVNTKIKLALKTNKPTNLQNMSSWSKKNIKDSQRTVNRYDPGSTNCLLTLN